MAKPQFKFADIDKASDCRRRIDALKYWLKLESKTWANMTMVERSQGDYGRLVDHFRHPENVMKEAIQTELARLKAELVGLGVSV